MASDREDDARGGQLTLKIGGDGRADRVANVVCEPDTSSISKPEGYVIAGRRVLNESRCLTHEHEVLDVVRLDARAELAVAHPSRSVRGLLGGEPGSSVRQHASADGAVYARAHEPASRIEDAEELSLSKVHSKSVVVVNLDVDRRVLDRRSHRRVRDHLIAEQDSNGRVGERHDAARERGVTHDGLVRDGRAIRDHAARGEEAVRVPAVRHDPELRSRFAGREIASNIHDDRGAKGPSRSCVKRGEVDRFDLTDGVHGHAHRPREDGVVVGVLDARVRERRSVHRVVQLTGDELHAEVGKLDLQGAGRDEFGPVDGGVHLSRVDGGGFPVERGDREDGRDACVRRSVREAAVGVAGVCV